MILIRYKNNDVFIRENVKDYIILLYHCSCNVFRETSRMTSDPVIWLNFFIRLTNRQRNFTGRHANLQRFKVLKHQYCWVRQPVLMQYHRHNHPLQPYFALILTNSLNAFNFQCDIQLTKLYSQENYVLTLNTLQ